ncbi:hypothetical protein CPB85DRAFT_1561404 [Mucidula mucida]|nr:hypothetical protein CPB85DRAFT_1568340 [Mucidula mucida]KAF8912499.1 hypothetical protein CPB85DRAFT_1561404 [Mucidula mucida]
MAQPGMARCFQSATERLAVSPAFDNHQESELFVRFVISTKLFNHIDPTVRNAPNNLCRKSEVNGKESYLTALFIPEYAVVTHATRVCSPCEYDLVEGMFISVHNDVPKHDWLFEGENKGIGHNFSALKNLDNHLAAGKAHGDVDKDIPSTPGCYILAPGDVRPETGYTPFTYALKNNPSAAVLGKMPGSWCAKVDKIEAPPSMEGDSKESLPTSTHDHSDQTHRRTVFKDCCSDLYSLMDYAAYALAMVQVIQALDHLRLAGYVHQNISPGNYLYTKDSSDVIQIKISDLEYACLYSTESPHTAPIPGPPGFVAVESQCLRHIFTPWSAAPPPEPFIYRGGKSTFCGPTVIKTVVVPKWFRFNFLHDMESALWLFWLFCWFLLYRLPSSLLGNVSHAQCERLAKISRELFGTSLDPPAMRRPFIGGFEANCLYPEAYELLQSCYEQDVQHGLTVLHGLIAFQSILRSYKEVESSTPIPTAKSFMWAPKEF